MGELRYVIRARYCQPSGVGWLTRSGHVTSNPRSRDILTFEWEGEAWDVARHSSCWGRDPEVGEYLWVEPDGDDGRLWVDIPGGQV